MTLKFDMICRTVPRLPHSAHLLDKTRVQRRMIAQEGNTSTRALMSQLSCLWCTISRLPQVSGVSDSNAACDIIYVRSQPEAVVNHAPPNCIVHRHESNSWSSWGDFPCPPTTTAKRLTHQGTTAVFWSIHQVTGKLTADIERLHELILTKKKGHVGIYRAKT